MSTIGQTIRKYRRQRGMSGKELAKAVGCSYNYINALERGVKDNPSLHILNQISQALDVSVLDLCDQQASSFVYEKFQVPEDLQQYVRERILQDGATESPRQTENEVWEALMNFVREIKERERSTDS